MRKNNRTRVGSEVQYDPRGTLKGWNRNTELSVDLKTILRSDRRMVKGREYQGVLRRDSETEVDEFLYRDPHYTFVETVPSTDHKRNPHVFVGKYISVTLRDDGTPRLNFKPLPDGGRDLNLERYALGVYNEICMALAGLVEK